MGPGGVPDPLADSLSEPVLHAGWSELGPVPVEDTLGTICYQSGYLARRKAPKFKGGTGGRSPLAPAPPRKTGPMLRRAFVCKA